MLPQSTDPLFLLTKEKKDLSMKIFCVKNSKTSLSLHYKMPCQIIQSELKLKVKDMLIH